MTSFQERVLSIKGFLGKLLPRTVSRSRKTDEESDEVGIPASFLDRNSRLPDVTQNRSWARRILFGNISCQNCGQLSTLTRRPCTTRDERAVT